MTASQQARDAGKTVVKRYLWLKLGIPGLICLAIVVIVVLLLMLAGAAGGKPDAAPSSGCGSPAVQPVSVTGQAAGLTAAQQSNAQAIASVAIELGLGERGVLIGELTALVEADLINVGFGDIMASGQMSSSRGLFQQLSAWITPGASPDPRLIPTEAAKMFYTGGAAGQKGLTDIAGWQTMPPEIAMQAVEQSEYSQLPGDQSPGLAGKLAKAQAITAALMAGQPSAIPVAATTACGVTPGGLGQVVPCTGGQNQSALAEQVLANPNLVVRAGREASQIADIRSVLQCNTVALLASMLTLNVPIRLMAVKSDHNNDGGYHPKGMALDLYYAAGDPVGIKVYEFLYRNYLALNVIQIIWAYPPTLPGIDPAKKCIQQNQNGIGATQGVLGDCDGLYPSDISGHTDHIHVAIHL